MSAFFVFVVMFGRTSMLISGANVICNRIHSFSDLLVHGIYWENSSIFMNYIKGYSVGKELLKKSHKPMIK